MRLPRKLKKAWKRFVADWEQRERWAAFHAEMGRIMLAHYLRPDVLATQMYEYPPYLKALLVPVA